jgi:hypothetical protein
MATQLTDPRSRRDRRLVVLVSEREKGQIEARARDAQMTVSDWLRTSGEQFEMPTEAEREELKYLFGRIADSNRRLSEALARTEALEARWASFDEATFRNELYAKLDADHATDWGVFSDLLGLPEGVPAQ